MLSSLMRARTRRARVSSRIGSHGPSTGMRMDCAPEFPQFPDFRAIGRSRPSAYRCVRTRTERPGNRQGGRLVDRLGLSVRRVRGGLLGASESALQGPDGGVMNSYEIRGTF